MSGEWVKWKGGNIAPVEDGIEVEMKLRDSTELGPYDTASNMRWTHYPEGNGGDIVEYRVIGAEAVKHSHYHKDVSKYSSIDVYRVLDLFGVTDQAIGHAAKKLLVAGGRGLKDITHDVQDVIDTLERWKEMRKEDNVPNTP